MPDPCRDFDFAPHLSRVCSTVAGSLSRRACGLQSPFAAGSRQGKLRPASCLLRLKFKL